MYGPATSSGELTSSAAVITMPGFCYGFEVTPPAIGLGTVKIYDNASAASGTIIAETTVAAGNNGVSIAYAIPRICNKGIYVAITGTINVVVGYSLG